MIAVGGGVAVVFWFVRQKLTLSSLKRNTEIKLLAPTTLARRVACTFFGTATIFLSELHTTDEQHCSEEIPQRASRCNLLPCAERGTCVSIEQRS